MASDARPEPPAPEKAAVPFEVELENVERVVAALERGDLSLEDSIRLFESGHRSLSRCYQILDGAQKRIEILAGASGWLPYSPAEGPAGPAGNAESDSSTESGTAARDSNRGFKE